MAEPHRQLDVRLLGPLEVRAGERLLPLTAAKQKTILALLALHRGEVVSVDALLEALWGERPPVSAQTALQGYVSQLRRLLESGEEGGAALLVTRAPGYLLDVDQEVDLARFESLTASGRDALARDDASGAARLLGDALQLWRGSPLAEFAYDGWARNEIARLEELRLAALEDRLEADLATGRHGELVAELEALVAEQPLRERLHAHLILALYRAGRQADALEAYQRARAVLVDELGLDPGPELQELHRLILNQDDTLAAPERALSAPIVHLPTPLTPLLGRERELAQAAARLSTPGVRLLTITGPGGIGKTRVAVELARQLADEHPDGVWFVDLSALRDPALVLPSVQQAVGADENLSTSLARRRALLVLDNFEQVLDAAGELGKLLSACPELQVVVTSREPLRLAGEHEYPLAPLSDGDAAALFYERARSIEPDFAANGEVAEICHRLDGLPLAIELAAARVKVLTAPQLLSRLEQRLPLLTTGARDLPDRQRTLRTTIEWSYELLTEEENRLFARLAVFSRGWSLEAAEDICDAGLDTLQALVDKSLVRARHERFTMLETIREYALSRFTGDHDHETVRLRHAQWYAALAQSLYTGLRKGSRAAGELLESELDNIRAALAWTADAGEGRLAGDLLGGIWPHLVGRAMLSEGVRWAARVRAAIDLLPPAEQLTGLHAVGELLRFHGNLEEAERVKQHELSILRKLGDQDEATVERLATTLHDLAGVAVQRRDLSAAEELIEEALSLRLDREDQTAVAQSMATAAAVRFFRGDELSARETYRAVSQMYLANDGNLDDLAGSYLMSGECSRRLGDLTAAASELRQGLALFRDIGERVSYVECLDETAGLFVQNGELELAATLLGAAERHERELELSTWDPDDREQTRREARDGLGTTGFDAAYERGTHLALDDALDLAIEHLTVNAVA